MKALFGYFKGYLKEMILGPFFKLLEAGIELLVPLLIAYLIDQIIVDKDQARLVLVVFSMIGLAILGVVVAVTAQYYSAKAAVGYSQVLTQDLFKHVMHLSKRDRDTLGASTLVTRLSSDTYQIQTGINLFLRLFLRAPIIVFGALIMAYLISPHLSLSFLAMILVLFLLVIALSRVTAPLYLALRQQLDKMVEMTREQVTGFRPIRAFGQAEREKQAFESLNLAYRDQQKQAGLWSASLAPLTYLVVNLTLLVLIWQGQFAVRSGQLSQGMLVALINYLLQILVELVKITVLATSLNQAFVSARRVQSIFDLEQEDLSKPLPSQSAESDLALQMIDLNFSYPKSARPSLSGLNLTLKVGDFLGIIGGTGSGKTSLINLLSGLDLPQSGHLSLFKDGQSAPDLKTWRDWVTLVPQKAQLFKGTIRDNLTLGKKGQALSDKALWRALDMALASEFVKEKGGLEAQVEAFGRNFSGGQRQRLTLARAFLNPAPFLILDDATSALDYLTEARVLSAVEKNLTDTTLIMVSQRTRHLHRVDQVLVLDEGQQIALGTHEELLANSPLYAEIHASQTKEVAHG